MKIKFLSQVRIVWQKTSKRQEVRTLILYEGPSFMRGNSLLRLDKLLVSLKRKKEGNWTEYNII